MIHPTAIIAETARLGANVRVGPYAIIGEHVVIGDNSIIDAQAIIEPGVIMGSGNRIHSHAVIGGLPQDLSFDPATETRVEIGNNCTFREGATVNRATKAGQATRLGSNCFLMSNTHVAHDCVIGDHCIFASGATLGGHVQMGHKVFMGGGSMVHQFCRIGAFAMVAGLIGIRKDVLPYTLVGGTPVRHYRLNTVGLRRAGISGSDYQILSRAFRRLRENQAIDDLAGTAEIDYLQAWLAEPSKRGYYGFAQGNAD